MIQLGGCCYDPESRILYRGNEEILLRPRVLAVFESLLKRPGKVVRKEDLLSSAWRGAFVAEASLTVAMSELREALGDDPREPTYIQTIPRRGYRLIAEVSTPPDDAAEQPAEADSVLLPLRPGDADGDADRPVAPIGPGSRLAGYEIIAALGTGGMGDVWRARDLELNREIAIKVMSAGGDASTLQRFIREARVLATLDHPNVVTVHSVEEWDGVHFLTMQLVEGRTLDMVIPVGGLPLDELLDLAIPMVDAVSAAHAHGITHRDLKPANIMVADDGRLRVLDFGLAKPDQVALPVEDDSSARPVDDRKRLHQPLTEVGRIMGTVGYMSPEQALGKPADARSDLFSLGVTLYEMATGTRPFPGDDKDAVIKGILHATPVPAAQLNELLPPELDEAIAKLLQKEPAARYQSATEIGWILDSIRHQIGTTRRRPALLAAAAAVSARLRRLIGMS